MEVNRDFYFFRKIFVIIGLFIRFFEFIFKFFECVYLVFYWLIEWIENLLMVIILVKIV